VRRYELIRGSGGDGEFRGGLGIRRDIEAVGHSARVSLLTDRRRRAPYGIGGGRPGAVGRNVRMCRDGSEEELPGKGSVVLAPGEAVSVRTPGGGGFGKPERRSAELRRRDLREERA
jgi:N-methylhydantoinase B